MRAAVTCALFAILALACASAANAMAASASASDRHGSGLLKRLRALRTRRTTAAAAAAVAATTIPTATAPVDLFGTDWSKVDFAGPVVVKAGATLFHSSPDRITLGGFTQGYTTYHGFWTTPDLAQSMAGGLNKAKSYGGKPVIVTALTVTKDITLFPLPSCARAGLAQAHKFGATGLKATLMANPSDGVHKALEQPCANWGKGGLHGWRSPWDQDEVMLCSIHQKTHLAIAYEYSCAYNLLGPNQSTETVYTNQKRFDSEEKEYPTAKFCGPLTPGKPVLKDNLFSYDARVHWASNGKLITETDLKQTCTKL